MELKMFKPISTAFEVGKHLKKAQRNLGERQRLSLLSTMHAPQDTETAFLVPYIEASYLAQNSGRQTLRVHAAIMEALHSPFTTPAIDEGLVKAARSMPLLSGYDRQELSRLTVGLDYGPRRIAAEQASANLKEHIDGSSYCFHAPLLATVAKTACAFDNWKGEVLIDAVTQNIKDPAQLREITKAVPNFIQTCVKINSYYCNRLHQVLDQAPQGTPAVAELKLEIEAERALGAIGYENALPQTLRLQAKHNPEFQERLTATLLLHIPQLVHMGAGERADELLCLLNTVSGKPLAPFNTLASREMYIGPEIFFTPETPGTAPDITRRPLVAAPEAYFFDAFQRSNDMSKFKLVHGPDTLTAMDVLDLHIKGFNGTSELDRARRATFDAARPHLGRSDVSLAAAWGALCVQSSDESTKRLGAKLLVASLKL
jgi:hypothetical protein